MTASSSIHFTNKGIRLTQLRLKFTRKGQIMHFETLQVTLISADTFILNVAICQFKFNPYRFHSHFEISAFSQPKDFLDVNLIKESESKF